MAEAIRRILLIGDDTLLHDAIRGHLAGHANIALIAEAATCTDGLRLVATEAVFDLVLLNAALSDMDAQAAFHALNRHGVHSVIVMLPGPGVADLPFTAGVHVAKPFRLGTLLAHVEDAIGPIWWSDKRVAVGPYTLIPAAKRLEAASNDSIRLTEKETAILRFLSRQKQAVNRHTLLRAVWGYKSAATHTLEAHIHRLRRKIEPIPSQPTVLITEDGGYRLVAG